MMVRVKICGITNPDDALAAVEAGADALGFVFADSPRRVHPDTARDIIRKLPPFVVSVGVFVNDSVERMRTLRGYCGLDVLQLHGDETDETVAELGGRIVKAIKVKNGTGFDLSSCGRAVPLLDTYDPSRAGGSGKSFDWTTAVPVARERPVILAGGLTPDNVAGAVTLVKPYAVDVSSGVEIEYGRKDHEKCARFIRNARSAL